MELVPEAWVGPPFDVGQRAKDLRSLGRDEPVVETVEDEGRERQAGVLATADAGLFGQRLGTEAGGAGFRGEGVGAHLRGHGRVAREGRAVDPIPDGKRRDDPRRLLRSVGLAGYEDKLPWQLSGGMQQRASICRALIHEPKMLLLDEPFGALDAFTREELWCILRDLWTAQRFNVILVTHDLREAVFLADTVYVMSKSPGRIVVRREIDLPRPRDLELTYTPRVHRHRPRAARAHRRDRQTSAG